MHTSLPRRSFLGRILAAFAGLSLPWGLGRARAETQDFEDPYLGEIRLVSFNFAPRFWALCNGQLLSISQNTALFSLLGTTYGGNGITTFALPDLRGRVAIHHGQGPGLTNRVPGEQTGELAHALTLNEMPTHTHVARCSSQPGTAVNPSTSVVPARNAAGIPQWGTDTASSMAPGALANTGANQAHDNTMPYTTLHYVISLSGVYPMPKRSEDGK